MNDINWLVVGCAALGILSVALMFLLHVQNQLIDELVETLEEKS